MTELTVNGNTHRVDVDPSTPLLWVLREQLELTGTKYACGQGQCGACTVLVDDKAVFACLAPVASVAGKRVTTIEGMPADHPLQAAWIDVDVPQCGYCQAGQIMRAAALLLGNPTPGRDEVIAWMQTNLCRCGTYPKILAAIEKAIASVPDPGNQS